MGEGKPKECESGGRHLALREKRYGPDDFKREGGRKPGIVRETDHRHSHKLENSPGEDGRLGEGGKRKPAGRGKIEGVVDSNYEGLKKKRSRRSGPDL